MMPPIFLFQKKTSTPTKRRWDKAGEENKGWINKERMTFHESRR